MLHSSYQPCMAHLVLGYQISINSKRENIMIQPLIQSVNVFTKPFQFPFSLSFPSHLRSVHVDGKDLASVIVEDLLDLY